MILDTSKPESSTNIISQNIAKAQKEIDRLEADADAAEAAGPSSSEKKTNGHVAADAGVAEATQGLESANIEDAAES